MIVIVKVLVPEVVGVPQTLCGAPQVEPVTSKMSQTGKLLVDQL
jgi:hypothetical protein